MKTVLVVDDEQDIRESITTILENKGYAVVVASNGDDCLKKLRKVTPDLILLDIMMPGMRVRDLLKKIKKFKVIFCSVVRISEAEKEDLLQFGNVVDFVQKPFKYKELLKTVAKHLGE